MSCRTFSLGPYRAEGITLGQDPNEILVSQIYFGGISQINIQTGEAAQVVQPTAKGDSHTLLGLQSSSAELGIVVGADSFPGRNRLRVWNISSGVELVACEPNHASILDAFSLNDVTILDNAHAYVTDSFNPSIMVVDLQAAVQNRTCVVSSIDGLPDNFQAPEIGSFRANGIAQLDASSFAVVTNDPIDTAIYRVVIDGDFPEKAKSITPIIEGVRADGIQVSQARKQIFLTGGSSIRVFSYFFDGGSMDATVTTRRENDIESELFTENGIPLANSVLFDSVDGKGCIYSTNLRFSEAPVNFTDFRPMEEERDNVLMYNQSFEVVGVELPQLPSTASGSVLEMAPLRFILALSAILLHLSSY